MRTVIPFVPPALLGFLLLKYEASDRLSAVLRRWLPARLSGSSSLRGILDMLSFFISFVCVGVGTGLYVVLLEKQLICLQFCLVSAVLTVIRAPMVVGIASLGWSLGRLARTPHSGAVQDAAAGCGLFAFFPLLWEAMTYFMYVLQRLIMMDHRVRVLTLLIISADSTQMHPL